MLEEPEQSLPCAAGLQDFVEDQADGLLHAEAAENIDLPQLRTISSDLHRFKALFEVRLRSSSPPHRAVTVRGLH
jgi:hypothetical protein